MAETRCFNLNHIVTIRVKRGRFGGDDPNDWLTVERRDGHDGTKWAVCDKGLCLNKRGKWEHEPQPSSRTDAFKNRCRWDSFDEAYDAAWNCKPYVYVAA